MNPKSSKTERVGLQAFAENWKSGKERAANLMSQVVRLLVPGEWTDDSKTSMLDCGSPGCALESG